MSWLHDYFLDQDGLFVVPVEHLSPTGMSAEYRELLRERTSFDDDRCALFDEAFRAYWQRTEELARQTPMYWFPPRIQNVCIVTDPDHVRPYFQPFHRASWLLYASDFDPRESNVELAVFQLLQAERMGLMQEIVPVLACNLSYFLTRSDEEVALFREACSTSTRPDAEAFQALAEALPWIRELHHEILKRPVVAAGEPLVTVPRTGLMIPRSRQPDVERLIGTWTRVVEQVAQRHTAAHATRERNHAEDLCAWLRDERPRVLVTGAKGRLLWDPAQPDELNAVRSGLKGVTKNAAESIRADLALVGRHSDAFVAALLQSEELAAPDPKSADQNGLSYMHLERREIAYNLREERMQRLNEPAPPYERHLLGARTIHEWGHLAAASGWIGVPEVRSAEHEELLAETGALFEEIVAGAPAQVRTMCADSLARLARAQSATGAGQALVRLALSRIEDYLSNLLSQRFLVPEERETYIRNNVRTLVHDYPREDFFQRLARYAYEYQYLRFSGVEDERTYFLRCTWFAEQYLKPGILSEDDFERLLDRMARVCDTYAVDETRFRPPVPG